MTALIRVEIRRLMSRRLMRVLVILFLAGFAVGGITTYVHSKKVAPGDFAERRRLEVARCMGDPLGPSDEMCEVLADDLTRDAVQNEAFDLIELEDVLGGAGGFMIVAALLVGASFAGAEWQKGTIVTTLTWEPRRERVFGAKVVAAAVSAFAGSLLLLALLAAALLPAALLKGSTAGADAEWLAHVLGGSARVALLAGLAATAGLSIAMIGRSTSAALGSAFVYLAIIEGMIRGWRPQWARWLIGDNGALFVSGSRKEVEFSGRSVTEAGLLLVAYVAVVALIAAGLFRRRDVT